MFISRNGSGRGVGACVALALALALLPFAAQSQQAKLPHRIGVVNDAWAANHPTVEGLKAGLRELGLEEGRDITFDIRFTQGKPEATPAAAAELVKAGVELLFTSNETATLAVKAATQKLPVVFTLVGDPITAGIVEQLAHPGGNVTGISSLGPLLMPKRVEVLKALFPAVKRVWYIHDATDPAGAAALAKGAEAAFRLGIEFIPAGVVGASDVTAVLATLKVGDGLLAPDQDAFDISASILQKSLASRIPAVFPSALWTEHGGLASYGADYYAQGVQAARLVAKILRGARAGDLPVEGADKIDLAVNLKTASDLGLPVPRKILLRADTIRR